MGLTTEILRHAITSPGRIAVVDDLGKWSYGRLAAGAMFLAQAIDRLTDRPTVGVLLPAGGVTPMAILAAWLSGRAAVPYNFLLRREELHHVVRDSGADVVVTSGMFLKFIGGREALPPEVNVIEIESVDFTGFPPLRWPPHVSEDDPAVILYTSGTAGQPKGVVLTHGNLQHNTAAAVVHAKLSSADVFLGVLPQFHSFGLTALTVLPLILGAKVVYSARFMPRRLVELIRQHRPQVFMAVPSMYGAILGVKELTADDLKSVRLLISGGEPLPQAMFEEYQARLNARVLEGYGLTETSPIVSWCTPHAWRRKSVGTLLPGVEVAIVDELDRALPVGAEGEILVAGPSIMKGYWKQPDATDKAIRSLNFPHTRTTRWFRTGDLGRLDDAGFLYITGRKKEMLKVAGEMVIPREIEEALNKHPSVKAAAVIGKPDDVRGEVPVAFVETREGEKFDEQTLRNWCRDNLAAFKLPREIRHVETLPRNATGKILRRELKA